MKGTCNGTMRASGGQCDRDHEEDTKVTKDTKGRRRQRLRSSTQESGARSTRGDTTATGCRSSKDAKGRSMMQKPLAIVLGVVVILGCVWIAAAGQDRPGMPT